MTFDLKEGDQVVSEDGEACVQGAGGCGWDPCSLEVGCSGPRLQGLLGWASSGGS